MRAPWHMHAPHARAISLCSSPCAFSFTCPPHCATMCRLLGPNGAGKSTSINMVRTRLLLFAVLLQVDLWLQPEPHDPLPTTAAYVCR